MHRCHAIGCTVPVPPRMLMCRAHWKRVPRALQADVWRTYREGQELTKRPTAAYLRAARRAIDHVYRQETRQGDLFPWGSH